MIRVNLLPIRAARKQDTAKQELMAMALGLIALVLVLYGWYARTGSQLRDAERQVQQVQTDISQLKVSVVRVEDFKKKAETLERKIGVIEQLRNTRAGPAKLLDDLATILGEQKKVWMSKIEERDGRLVLEGGAMEHENISDFQLALENRSKLFRDITLTRVHSIPKGNLTVLEWQITCRTNYNPG